MPGTRNPPNPLPRGCREGGPRPAWRPEVTREEAGPAAAPAQPLHPNRGKDDQRGLGGGPVARDAEGRRRNDGHQSAERPPAAQPSRRCDASGPGPTARTATAGRRYEPGGTADTPRSGPVRLPVREAVARLVELPPPPDARQRDHGEPPGVLTSVRGGLALQAVRLCPTSSTNLEQGESRPPQDRDTKPRSRDPS